ncbi:hypothetical protein D3C80_2210580 [compost metagenome]
MLIHEAMLVIFRINADLIKCYLITVDQMHAPGGRLADGYVLQVHIIRAPQADRPAPEALLLSHFRLE